MTLVLLFKYCRYFHSSNICERPLPDTTCIDLSEKYHLKWAIFVFLILCLIDLYFISGSKKRFWLMAFLTFDILLWFHMMERWQLSIVNRKGYAENAFAFASDHRIFVLNLSFREYLHVYQKYFRNHKFDFYGEIFFYETKGKFHFPIYLLLFFITNCYVDHCEPQNRVPFEMSQLYFLLDL